MDMLTVILLSFCVGQCYGQNTKRKLAGLRLDVDSLRNLALELKLEIDGLKSLRNATCSGPRETGVIDSGNEYVDSQSQGSFDQSLDVIEERVSYIMKGLEREKVVVREMMEDFRQTDANLKEYKLTTESKVAELEAKLNEHLITTQSKDAKINEQLNRLSTKLETSIGEVLGQLKDLSARLDTNTNANSDTREQVTHPPKQTSTTVQDTTVTMNHRSEQYYIRMKQDGWLQNNNSLYKLFKGRANFSTAVKSCEDNGASLAEITDMAELWFIADNFYHQYYMWVGVTDLQTEGEWRWLSGQLVEFVNWAPNQPNNWRGNEDCVAVVHKNYYDRDCSRKEYYLCEI